jgi:hypothetical protein
LAECADIRIPEDLILRSCVQHGVSKGGRTRCGLWPFFETALRAS